MKLMDLFKFAAVGACMIVCASSLPAQAQIATPPPPGSLMQPVATPPPAEPAAEPASVGPGLTETYILGSGDRIRLIVFGEPNLSGDFFVDSTGKVALPLIGEIKADGLSLREFEGAVEAQLKRGYLNDPRVSAEVLNFRPFYILGEVTHPGTYPYTSGLTVFNAVATAGGFTYRANQHSVKIKHEGVDKEVDERLTPSLAVQPGDTIRIKERWF